jgi:tetratricopeptide (TPR) repeat protein
VDSLEVTLQNRLLLELAIDVISARIARDPNPDWLLTRCRWQTRVGRTAAAAADLGRVLAANPAVPLGAEYAVAFGGLGEAAAEAGEWEKAAGHYARAVELAPGDAMFWYARLLLALRTGDAAAYRRGCAEVVERFAQATGPLAGSNVAWVCSLAPGAVDDPTAPARLAEPATRVDLRPAVKNTLGAALYRAGRYDEAVEKLTAAAKAIPPNGTPWDWVFLAMAHHRLGHRHEARVCLGRAAGSARGSS